ncbi:hypothetical protein [Oceanobacillus alkalisoli]|uniref:hypothetical protein n=1 Tax=Oceanobacillus alkalisoli TaxID=2925113 RepID=UPI001EE402C4|nr:hypothetical protein [Oceanobacillus alkalisoli]MCG5104016.1 hypothetical protein [Oceanobacillus alkalisoli]
MKRRLFIHVPVVFLLTLCFWTFEVNPVSGNTATKEVSIERYPDEVLFQLENMKPGDAAYRTLAIKNIHNQDITYTMELHNAGDPTLYDALLLRVMYLDEVIFYGKLKDYEGIVERPLKSHTEETIEFGLEFPQELGNEYQGLNAAFHLEFTAKAIIEESVGAATLKGEGKPQFSNGKGVGFPLPRTATHLFTYLLIGLFLLFIGGIIGYSNKRKKRLQR